MSDHLMSTYARLPVSFVRGEGAWLWDDSGRRYLDALSGIAVCGLGHAHPEVARAIAEQAATLMHTSNVYGIPLQAALAERLCALAGMDRAFFCNSGAEANEAAIKLARLHARRRGIEQPVILVAEKSFHGRTLATLSATGNAKVKRGFEPLVVGFRHVPYGDTAALQAAMNENVVAVLLEAVQGEGGVHVAPAGYLAAVRTLCERHDWLMMLDEVQAGIARTGTWFGFQHAGVVPDVITLAKGLGNGFPIGACLARGHAAALFQPGSHGSTFGGNPLACRTALSVLDIIERDHLPLRAAALGERMQQGFRAALDGCGVVREIRGLGLMLGIELARPCAELVRRALDAAILINVTADSVIRLLPPLTLSDAEADEIVARVSRLIHTFAREDSAS